jgi:hypothetical protein
MNENPLNPDTVTPPEGMGSVDVTKVAVVVVSSESLVAEVEVASKLVEAVEVVASVVEVVAMVVAAVMVSSTVVEVINVTLGQHPTL